MAGTGVAPDPEEAWLAKKTESAPTSPTPMPASQRVVVEMRRIPVSRSTDRCGVTVGPLTSRTVLERPNATEPGLTPGKNAARIDADSTALREPGH